jgi:hypothetical protein
MTGSRSGITDAQRTAVTELLSGNHEGWPRVNQLHHGDCIGADWEIHVMAMQLTGILVVSHPPIDSKLRAYCNAHVVMPPRPYLDRNRDIVTMSTRMFALPSGEEKSQPRSGTWSTVRYAALHHRPVLIIYPDGREQVR